ncbi:MAG TPA: hypothetical protein VMZ27_05325, partial [Candidatus Saccharimonadales bacterium]|nr:hypothetical protein [Candidatus Saccharimonadales bacterium]
SATPVQIRFRNDGGKKYLRAEASLVYQTVGSDKSSVTFDWTDTAGHHNQSHSFSDMDSEPWAIKTAANVRTRWVELAVVAP